MCAKIRFEPETVGVRAATVTAWPFGAAMTEILLIILIHLIIQLIKL